MRGSAADTALPIRPPTTSELIGRWVRRRKALVASVIVGVQPGPVALALSVVLVGWLLAVGGHYRPRFDPSVVDQLTGLAGHLGQLVQLQHQLAGQDLGVDEQVVERRGGAGLGVVGAEHHASDPAVDRGTGTHGARFERHHERCIVEAPLAPGCCRIA